jgi:AcrR family transcriptional regulator
MNESTRDRLIRHARVRFADQGFDGASVREITAAAGANLGAITYHFGSKAGLYAAVLEESFGPVIAALSRPAPARGVDSPATPLDRVEAIMRVAFSRLAARPEMPLLALQHAVRQQSLPGPAQTLIDAVHGALSMAIREGQRDGSIVAGDPSLMALSAMAQPFYFGLVRRLAPERLRDDGAAMPAPDEIADHAVQFIRSGLSAAQEAK